MAKEWIGNLIAQLHQQKIDRREFAQRAGALGLSATLIGQVLRAAPAGAQDATPEGEALTVGNPEIAHLTETELGMVKFFSSWPLTGASEQLGGDMVASLQMALDDFGNAAGGFAIEYTALDDGIAANNGSWDAAKEAENATSVVNDLDAMVYIGTYNSGAAAVSIPIMNEADPGPMAMISPANTYPGLTKESPDNEEGEPDRYYPTGIRNYMRVVPADDLQGPAAAAWAVEGAGLTNAYVLHDNQLYGRGVAAAFRDTFEDLGGAVAGFEAFDPNAPDYLALMTQIASSAPDVIYVGAITNLNPGKLLQDMRSVMPVSEVTFIGPDGLINQAFIDGSGEAAQDAYVTFAGLPPNALQGAGAQWYTRIQERLGHEPDAYAVYAYECAVVAIQALDQVQVNDRVEILDAMFATNNFAGLLGTWEFLETGDTSLTTVSLNQIQDGGIVFLEE
ncbi:MAG: branched-chain amino acid ABC transporter substrate-binding protein, partial [Chloroflexota bacterium]|nr:branched-chain amino acid ABC transporter substrate-binding protein [Chloroflexota bacterium]